MSNVTDGELQAMLRRYCNNRQGDVYRALVELRSVRALTSAAPDMLETLHRIAKGDDTAPELMRRAAKDAIARASHSATEQRT